jgi:hypothetical protein
MIPKRVTNSWLPFCIGAATAALAFALASGWGAGEQPQLLVEPGRPEKLLPAATLPAAPADGASHVATAQAAAPAAQSSPARQSGSHSPGTEAAGGVGLALDAPGGQALIQVTATAPVPTMAPVVVTPTPPLSVAEEEARARRAVEAMRQSTQGMESQMPAAP